MLGLFVEGLREVEACRALHRAEEEQVGKAGGLHAVQRRWAVGPLLGQRHAAGARDLVAGAAGVAGADFETGGEDDAIDLVLLAVRRRSRSR